MLEEELKALHVVESQSQRGLQFLGGLLIVAHRSKGVGHAEGGLAGGIFQGGGGLIAVESIFVFRRLHEHLGLLQVGPGARLCISFSALGQVPEHDLGLVGIACVHGVLDLLHEDVLSAERLNYLLPARMAAQALEVCIGLGLGIVHAVLRGLEEGVYGALGLTEPRQCAASVVQRRWDIVAEFNLAFEGL